MHDEGHPPATDRTRGGISVVDAGVTRSGGKTRSFKAVSSVSYSVS
jgi:hypothetical protein